MARTDLIEERVTKLTRGFGNYLRQPGLLHD